MSYIEESSIEDDSVLISKNRLGSILEPRDPSITNPWMRPRPVKGTNLCHLFEEVTPDGVYKVCDPQHLRVYLRMKPLSDEQENDPNELYDLRDQETLVSGGTLYRFSHIFHRTNQVTVFNRIMKDSLRSFVNGHDFTLVSYGASGSGKTYSLMGQERQPGVLPRCLEFLFNSDSTPTSDGPRFRPGDGDTLISIDSAQKQKHIQAITNIVKKCGNVESAKEVGLNAYRRMSTVLMRASMEWRQTQKSDMCTEVWVSFAEIYNDSIHDLLQEYSGPPAKLRLMQPPNNKPYIKGLRWICVRSGIEAYSVMMYGRTHLRYAHTSVNATSSRSHCIFTLKMIKYQIGSDKAVVSSLRLCDLAGLERAKMTGNKGDRLNESKKINTSLHVLERCLAAIRNRTLPPYRESKLTALLQYALAGKENISMLVTINPEKKFFDETQHVLKFSALAQEIVVEEQPRMEINMSRCYSEIAPYPGDKMGSEEKIRLAQLEVLEARLEAREARLEAWELGLEDREATLEAREADQQWEWEEKARNIRSEVAAKFRAIQTKIQADCDEKLEQQKKFLDDDHQYYIKKWTLHSEQLQQQVDTLSAENHHLREKILVLQHQLERVSHNSLPSLSDLFDKSDTTINYTADFVKGKRSEDDFMKDFASIDIVSEQEQNTNHNESINISSPRPIINENSEKESTNTTSHLSNLEKEISEYHTGLTNRKSSLPPQSKEISVYNSEVTNVISCSTGQDKETSEYYSGLTNVTSLSTANKPTTLLTESKTETSSLPSLSSEQNSAFTTVPLIIVHQNKLTKEERGSESEGDNLQDKKVDHDIPKEIKTKEKESNCAMDSPSCDVHKSPAVLGDHSINIMKGLPLPSNFCTVKKEKRLDDNLAKENRGVMSSRRKLFSRRKLDEMAADPSAVPTGASSRCLFRDENSEPSPEHPPSVPKPYICQPPVRATRRKAKRQI